MLAIDKLLLPEYRTDPALASAWNLSAACPLLLALGTAVQTSNFPERFLRRDATAVLGHSHQLWHLCTMLVMWVWVRAITRHCEARALTSPCHVGRLRCDQ